MVGKGGEGRRRRVVEKGERAKRKGDSYKEDEATSGHEGMRFDGSGKY